MAEKFKEFENRFKRQFLSTVPNSTIDRLYDTTNGFLGVSNISDFIGYSKPYIFYLECKSHGGASLPFSDIPQYDKLLQKVGIPGVRSGVILWLYDKDIVMYVPISTVKQIKDIGEKSVGIRHLKDFNIKVLPSVKKRVFMDTDYSDLLNLQDNE